MVNHDGVFQDLKSKDEGTLAFINAEMVYQMVQHSILQQNANPLNSDSRARMVTGLKIPQASNS